MTTSVLKVSLVFSWPYLQSRMLFALGFVIWKVYYFYVKVIFKKKEKYLWSPSQDTFPKWTEALIYIFQ